MTNRQTAAYPPGPARNANPKTEAATLFARPEAAQVTLFVNGESSGPSDPGQVLDPATLGRGSVTVLPEVRSEGEKLVIVPRSKTRYVADKLLGRGGMGEVKLAHDHDIGRKVAVKRLLDEQSPHAVARSVPTPSAPSTAPRTRPSTEPWSGPPQYMSPEQAAGQVAELDGRSDLYSAFVVLYELLTLTPYIPAGKTAMEMVLAAQERQPPAVIDSVYNQSAIQDAVPAELRHFIRRGLQNDKDARYDSAEEVIWALERLRSGECAVECPVTFIKHNGHKLERFMDRHPQASVMLATLSVVGFLGGVAGWVTWLIG